MSFDDFIKSGRVREVSVSLVSHLAMWRREAADQNPSLPRGKENFYKEYQHIARPLGKTKLTD